MADDAWWCTPCGAWRRTKRLVIGRLCSTCGSGRVRPPMPGELASAASAALPPLSAAEVKAQLDGDDG